jgi:hypothetical protein
MSDGRSFVKRGSVISVISPRGFRGISASLSISHYDSIATLRGIAHCTSYKLESSDLRVSSVR